MDKELNKNVEQTEDLSDFDFQNDIFAPMAQQNMLYSSRQMQFFNENKIDRAPLFGQEPYNYAGLIKQQDAQAAENIKAFGEGVVEFMKAAPEYIMETGENYLDRMKLAGKNMEDVGINLKPFVVDYLQKVPGPLSFAVAGTSKEKAYQEAITRGKELDIEKKEINDKLNEREDLFQFVSGVVMQDAPAVAGVYKVMKEIPGLNKPTAMVMSYAIGSALSFGEEETIDNFMFDSVMVDKFKEMLNVLPDTPEEEIAERAYQVFEYAATGKVIDSMIKGFKFLKKFPKFAAERPIETSTAIGAATAVTPTEVEGSPLAKLGKGFIEKGGRRLVGLSQETSSKVPTTFEQQVGAKQLENVFSNDPSIKAFKVDDSFGRYGDQTERNFDIELLVGENFNDQNVLKKAVDIAEKNNQEAVLYSKSTSSQNPKASPAFSINFKEPLYYKDAQEVIEKTMNDFGVMEGYTAKTSTLDFGQTKLMELPKPNQQIIEAAKAKFKPTTNMTNAGYILPDGTLLDLGRSYGSGRGGAVEHRDVAAIALGGKKPGTAEQMFDFMNKTGAIRISPFENRLFAQTYYKPTKQQLRQIEKFNKQGGYEEIVMDTVYPGKDVNLQLFQTNADNRVFEVAPGETFNVNEADKFFDPQSLSSKTYSGVRSIYIPDFAMSGPEDYIDSIQNMERSLKNDDIIGNVDIEFFETNLIRQKDYGKYK